MADLAPGGDLVAGLITALHFCSRLAGIYRRPLSESGGAVELPPRRPRSLPQRVLESIDAPQLPWNTGFGGQRISLGARRRSSRRYEPGGAFVGYIGSSTSPIQKRTQENAGCRARRNGLSPAASPTISTTFWHRRRHRATERPRPGMPPCKKLRGSRHRLGPQIVPVNDLFRAGDCHRAVDLFGWLAGMLELIRFRFQTCRLKPISPPVYQPSRPCCADGRVVMVSSPTPRSARRVGWSDPRQHGRSDFAPGPATAAGVSSHWLRNDIQARARI